MSMSTEDNPNYRKFFFFGIIQIALGVVFSTSLEETSGSLGVVLIALGGLFFIIAMKKKRDADQES